MTGFLVTLSLGMFALGFLWAISEPGFTVGGVGLAALSLVPAWIASKLP